MFSKLIPDSKKHGLYFPFRAAKAFGNIGNGIQIPIAAQKDAAFFNSQWCEESVDDIGKDHVIDPARAIVGSRNTLLHLRTQFTDVRISLQAAAV